MDWVSICMVKEEIGVLGPKLSVSHFGIRENCSRQNA